MRRILKLLGALALLAVVVWFVRPRLLYPFFPSGHTIIIQEQRENLLVQGAYPEFGRARTDAHIKALVQDTVIQPALDALASHPHEPGTSDTFTVSYEVLYRTLRYRSVLLHVVVDAQDFKGQYVIARTYDLLRDTPLGLQGLALPGRDPLPGTWLAVRLHTQERTDVDQASLIRMKSSLSAFENLLVRSDGLEFYFNPGQIAAHEHGVVKVFIPWEEIGGVQQP